VPARVRVGIRVRIRVKVRVKIRVSVEIICSATREKMLGLDSGLG
jgi:hypothetical protein